MGLAWRPLGSDDCLRCVKGRVNTVLRRKRLIFEILSRLSIETHIKPFATTDISLKWRPAQTRANLSWARKHKKKLDTKLINSKLFQDLHALLPVFWIFVSERSKAKAHKQMNLNQFSLTVTKPDAAYLPAAVTVTESSGVWLGYSPRTRMWSEALGT